MADAPDGPATFGEVLGGMVFGSQLDFSAEIGVHSPALSGGLMNVTAVLVRSLVWNGWGLRGFIAVQAGQQGEHLEKIGEQLLVVRDVP